MEPEGEILQIGDEAFYTIPQAAAVLSASVDEVERLIELGVIGHVGGINIILIPENSLSRHIADSRPSHSQMQCAK